MPKYTQGTRQSVPKKPHKPENQAPPPEKKRPSTPALAAFAAAVASKPAGPRAQEPAATDTSSKRSKKSPDTSQALAAKCSRYNRNKSSPPGHPFGRLESNQQKAREVAAVLRGRAYSYDDDFYRIARKLDNCSVYGAFRWLPSGAANKTGQALCKHRACPICQRVQAVKRRDALSLFITENQPALAPYYFYHLVLTLRHKADDDVRTHFYLPDLIRYFRELRGVEGKITTWRKWWDKRVAGGFSSIETEPSGDKTAHIHYHILLAGKMPLWADGRTSKFLEAVKAKWMELTWVPGDTQASTQVHLEPVFTWRLDEQGEELRDENGDRVKDYAHKAKFGGADSDQHLLAAVCECAKYTMKTDAKSLDRFSDDMLRDLLTQRHRFYSRFGCFHQKHPDSVKFKGLDKLNADFKDLEALDAKRAAALWCPVNKEQVPVEDSKQVISTFRNTVPKQAGGSCDVDEATGKPRGHENYYEFIDEARVVEYTDNQEFAKALSRTIYQFPDADNQLLPPEDAPAYVPVRASNVLPGKWYALNNFRYHDDSDWLSARAADDAAGISIRKSLKS